MKNIICCLLLLLPIGAVAVPWQDYPSADLRPGDYTFPYTSPYTISTTIPQLLWDFPSRYASIPARTRPAQAQWYDPASYKTHEGAAWGPRLVGSLGAVTAPPQADASYGTLAWQQQRLVAVARQFQLVQGNVLGVIYQHHHIPQYNPYAGDPNWPANLDGKPPITWGRAHGGTSAASAGMDCSNFTSLVYNLAFGYRLSTEVKAQAQPETKIITPTGSTHPTLIPGPNMGKGGILASQNQARYEAVISQFQVGDLLFMHTGSVELPFAADSWFYRHFDHALKILPISR